MGRNDKLLERILKKPKDFTYDELRRLLVVCNALKIKVAERPARV